MPPAAAAIYTTTAAEDSSILPVEYEQHTHTAVLQREDIPAAYSAAAAAAVRRSNTMGWRASITFGMLFGEILLRTFVLCKAAKPTMCRLLGNLLLSEEAGQDCWTDTREAFSELASGAASTIQSLWSW